MDVVRSRADWPTTFILMAHQMAVLRSKDPKRAVGVVVADAENRIVATGYNGLRPGEADKTSFWHGPKREGCIHAEEIALDYLNDKVDPTLRKHLRMFVSHVPCEGCAEKIAQSGYVESVFYPLFVRMNYQLRGDKINEIKIAEGILARSGVQLVDVDVDWRTLAETSTAMAVTWHRYAMKGLEAEVEQEVLSSRAGRQ